MTAASLNRRVFIKKLPDRGERIRDLKDRLENELKRRHDLLDVCQVMSGLTVNGKNLSEKLEWCGESRDDQLEAVKNGDHHSSGSEDESDLIKILATHSGAGYHHKIHR